jgi:hypothetical protein
MPPHKHVTDCLKTGGPISPHCTCPHCALSVCSVCAAYEGGLTTDCPGEHLTADRQDEIYKEGLNFIDGVGWYRALPKDAPVAPRFEPRELGDKPTRTPDEKTASEQALVASARAWARADRAAEDRYAVLLRAEEAADVYLAGKRGQDVDEHAAGLLAKLEREKIGATLADQRAQECDGRMRAAARRLIDTPDLAGRIVHVLRCGHAVCDFTNDPPRKWPPGHLWTRIEQLEEEATCPGCLAIIREATKDDR